MADQPVTPLTEDQYQAIVNQITATPKAAPSTALVSSDVISMLLPQLISALQGSGVIPAPTAPAPQAPLSLPAGNSLAEMFGNAVKQYTHMKNIWFAICVAATAGASVYGIPAVDPLFKAVCGAQ